MDAGAGGGASASTTHFVVADRAGNIVSGTQTVGARFGCGETIEGTGLLMNDRSWWMSLASGPNIVGPLKRANIGHAPVMLLQDDRPFAAFGSPGGFGVVQYIVQTICNLIDYGHDIQSAIEAPRFQIEDLRGVVGFEDRICKEVRDALSRRGHVVREYPSWTDQVGGVEGFFRDSRNGNMLAGYDPRRNSAAVGF
jgi:gamma-glutamyltranspeptidase/glutathione hydrolase